MGQNIKYGETPVLAAAFSAGLGTGLRTGELNTGDRKFLRHVVGLTEHDVAHIAYETKPHVKSCPERLRDFDLA